MNPAEIKSLLKGLHIAAWVAGGAVIIVGGFLIYKNILETTQTKLEIKKLRAEEKRNFV